MLTFNLLLRAGSLDPRDVRLVRHKPSRDHHRAIFDAAMRGDQAFHLYQTSQHNPQVVAQFRAAKHLASFAVDPFNQETVFIGIWDRLGEGKATDEGVGSVVQPGRVVFETQLRHEFDAYRGRVIIDWGDGERAWVQRADSKDKPIIEIRKQREDPAFPGFSTFRQALNQIEAVPVSWSEVLRNARGVYLIAHRDRGDQYVGSASGADGFLGRWMNYADGHGGNVAMRELGAEAEAYDVCVLEVVGSNATAEDVFACEESWKAKLGTKVKGLNRN